MNEFLSEVYGDLEKELKQICDYEVPENYVAPFNPSSMQISSVFQLLNKQHLGNFSAPGAGKTLAAILSSCKLDAKLTVIFCPNNVVGDNGWVKELAKCLQADSYEVQLKTWSPVWKSKNKPRYLILTYEGGLQAEDSSLQAKTFLEENKVDFLVLDEMHYAKRRSEETSARHDVLMNFRIQAGEDNPDLHVLGMTATPVVNNLTEGKHTIEMIKGEENDSLETRKTLDNAMKMHQEFSRCSLRVIPDYEIECEECDIPIKGDSHLEEFLSLGDNPTESKVDRLLTEIKMSTILENLVPKTIIYTHYVDGIVSLLKKEVSAANWTVGVYTGEDKSGLEGFWKGDIDVLIASSAIATGVDGLQDICDRIIISSLPWTNAGYQQLVGRVYRKGQKKKVDIFRLLVYVTDPETGEERSNDRRRMQIIENKETIADAVLDGSIGRDAEEKITQKKAKRAFVKWTQNIAKGDVKTHVVTPLEPKWDATNRKGDK